MLAVRRRRAFVAIAAFASLLATMVGMRTAGAAERPIVFAASETKPYPTDIYRINADGSGLSNITNDPSLQDDQPVLSPDGTRVAFVSLRDGQQGIFVIDLDGSNLRRLTTGDTHQGPAWSPDGGHVIFTEGTGPTTLMRVPVTGGAPSPYLDDLDVDEVGPDVTTDGTKVGFVIGNPSSVSVSGSAVGLRDLATGAQQVIETDTELSPGKSIDFVPGGRYVLVPELSCSVVGCSPRPTILDMQTGETYTVPFFGDGDAAISSTGSTIVSFAYDTDADAFYVGKVPFGDPYAIPEPVSEPVFFGIGHIDWGVFGSGGGSGGGGGGGDDGSDVTTGRVSGPSRFDTAAEIAKRQWPSGAPVVYLARADVVVDAVAGGVLTDGPTLLVHSCEPLPEVVSQTLSSLSPVTVTALGGENSVCDGVLEEARVVSGASSISRLAGESRFGTAAAIGLHEFPDGAPVAFVARADNVVDAVAGGVLTDGPVFLVPKCGEIPAVTNDALRRTAPAEVIALGGTGSICEETLERARGAAGASTTGRLAGASRYQTSVKIGQYAFPGIAPVVYLARGDVFVDAVAGGTLTDGPVLLVPSCGTLPDEVVTAIDGFAPDEVLSLGGPNSVCDDVLTQAAAAAR